MRNKKNTFGKQKVNSRYQKGSSGKKVNSENIRAFLRSKKAHLLEDKSTRNLTHNPHCSLSGVVIFGCFKSKYKLLFLGALFPHWSDILALKIPKMFPEIFVFKWPFWLCLQSVFAHIYFYRCICNTSFI